MLPVVKVFNYFTEHGTVPEFELRSVRVPVSRFLRLGAYQYVEFALIDDSIEFILRYFLHGCIVH